jgi:hypothetical protein
MQIVLGQLIHKRWLVQNVPLVATYKHNYQTWIQTTNNSMMYMH